MPEQTGIIFATAGYDHTIRFWEPQSGACLRTAQHPDSQVNALAISPKGTSLAAVGYQHIRLYDVQSENAKHCINYDGMSKNVTSVGFNSEEKWMYVTGEDGKARIIDLRSTKCLRRFECTSPLNCAVLHPNNTEIIMGDQAGQIHFWDIRENSAITITSDVDTSIEGICLNAEADTLGCIDNRGSLKLWNLYNEGTMEGRALIMKSMAHCHSSYGLGCQFSPDSTLIATCGADRSAKVWKTSDYSLVANLVAKDQQWVWDLAWSNDSAYLITCSSDNKARLWNVENCELRKEYLGHVKPVTCLAFKDVQADV